jgi:hypothetical protein
MAMDPRLESVLSTSRDPNAQVAARVRDLERRLAQMDRGGRRTYVATGAPTLALPDGAESVDPTTNRLWVRVGGVWRYTALT